LRSVIEYWFRPIILHCNLDQQTLMTLVLRVVQARVP
jgi:hypothetical protein